MLVGAGIREILLEQGFENSMRMKDDEREEVDGLSNLGEVAGSYLRWLAGSLEEPSEANGTCNSYYFVEHSVGGMKVPFWSVFAGFQGKVPARIFGQSLRSDHTGVELG